MAVQSELLIKIKTLIEGLENLKKLGTEIAGTTAAQEKGATASARAREEYGRFNKAAQGSGDAIKSLNGNIKGLEPGFEKVIGLFQKATLALVAYAGVAKLKDLAETAARTETLGVTLNVVGRTAGYSKEQLAGYEKELVKLGITTQVARDSLTKLIQAGINLNEVNKDGATTAAALARAAQDLAVVTGENSSNTLQRLITNIQQLDTVGLRYQGLVVSLDDAQEKFAQSIGKSVDQLTQQQRTQAFLNATMEQAAKLQGAYVESMDTAAKKAASLARFQQELANTLGEKLLPAYGGLIDVTTDFLKNLIKISTETDKSGAEGRKFGETIKAAFKSVTNLVESVFRALAGAAPEFNKMAREVGGLVKVIFDVATALVQWLDNIGAVKFAFFTIGLVVAGLKDAFYGVSGIFAAFVDIALSGLGAIIGLAAELAGVFSDDIKNALDEVSKGINENAAEYAKYAGQVKKDFEDGNTATQKYIQGLDEATEKTKAFGKATNFTTAQEEIRKLSEAVRQNTLTSQEAATAADQIRTRIKQMGDEHKVTADQVKVLNAQLTAATSKIDQEYAKALADLDISFSSLAGSSQRFAQSTDGDLGKISGALLTLADNARTLEGQFSQAFSKGLGAAKTLEDLTKLSQAITEAGKNSKLVNDAAEAASLAALKFEELFQAELKAAQTQGDFAKLVVELEKLRDAGIISEQTFVTGFGRVQEAVQNLQLQIANADIAAPLKNLGTSIEQVKTGTTEAARTIVQQLEQVRASAKLTSAEFFDLFAKNLSTAKTVQDLKLFQVELDKARRSGQIFGEALDSALQKISSQFDKIFSENLNSATTQQEFTQLRDRVIELGEEGVISGAKVSEALAQIQEKSTGARDEIQRLSSQMVELAEAESRVSQAFSEVGRAGLDLQRAKNDLVRAEARYREEGTEASRLEVEAQREVVRAVEAKAVLSQLKYRQELETLELIRLKHAQINAEKLRDKDPSNAANVAAANAAREQADNQQLVVDRTRTMVANQEAVVQKTQLAADRAKQLASNMKEASSNAEATAKNTNRIGQESKFVGESIAAWNTQGISNALQQAGLTLKEANAQAENMLAKGQYIIAFGLEGVTAWVNVYNQILKVGEEVRRQQAEAKELTTRYQNIRSNAEDIAKGLLTASEAAGGLDGALQQVQKAMAQIRKDARATADSAIDAARAFANSASSINEELLSAQGREDEAARIRFEQRRRELAIETEMLKIRIQAAIITARAAGLTKEVSELERALASVNTNYKQALGALSELEKLELEKIRARKDEERRQREEADKKKREEAQEQLRKEREKKNTKPDTEEKKPPTVAESVQSVGRIGGFLAGGVGSSLQSIASDSARGNSLGSALGTTINLNFDQITSFGDQKTLATQISRYVMEQITEIQRRSQ